jgi:hypothetical protein
VPAFDIACADLANLLTSAMRPRVERVECATSTWLDLRLVGVDTGTSVLGMSLPRVDVDLGLRLALVDPATAHLTWELRDVGGLPEMIRLMLPKERIGRGLVGEIVERMRWRDCSELGDDRLVLHLRRMELGGLDPAQIRYDELAVPGRAGCALTVRLGILPAGGGP